MITQTTLTLLSMALLLQLTRAAQVVGVSTEFVGTDVGTGKDQFITRVRIQMGGQGVGYGDDELNVELKIRNISVPLNVKCAPVTAVMDVDRLHFIAERIADMGGTTGKTNDQTEVRRRFLERYGFVLPMTGDNPGDTTPLPVPTTRRRALRAAGDPFWDPQDIENRGFVSDTRSEGYWWDVCGVIRRYNEGPKRVRQNRQVIRKTTEHLARSVEYGVDIVSHVAAMRFLVNETVKLDEQAQSLTNKALAWRTKLGESQNAIENLFLNLRRNQKRNRDARLDFNAQMSTDFIQLGAAMNDLIAQATDAFTTGTDELQALEDALGAVRDSQERAQVDLEDVGDIIRLVSDSISELAGRGTELYENRDALRALIVLASAYIVFLGTPDNDFELRPFLELSRGRFPTAPEDVLPQDRYFEMEEIRIARAVQYLEFVSSDPSISTFLDEVVFFQDLNEIAELVRPTTNFADLLKLWSPDENCFVPWDPDAGSPTNPPQNTPTVNTEETCRMWIRVRRFVCTLSGVDVNSTCPTVGYNFNETWARENFAPILNGTGFELEPAVFRCSGGCVAAINTVFLRSADDWRAYQQQTCQTGTEDPATPLNPRSPPNAPAAVPGTVATLAGEPVAVFSRNIFDGGLWLIQPNETSCDTDVLGMWTNQQRENTVPFVLNYAWRSSFHFFKATVTLRRGLLQGVLNPNITLRHLLYVRDADDPDAPATQDVDEAIFLATNGRMQPRSRMRLREFEENVTVTLGTGGASLTTLLLQDVVFTKDGAAQIPDNELFTGYLECMNVGCPTGPVGPGGQPIATFLYDLPDTRSCSDSRAHMCPFTYDYVSSHPDRNNPAEWTDTFGSVRPMMSFLQWEQQEGATFNGSVIFNHEDGLLSAHSQIIGTTVGINEDVRCVADRSHQGLGRMCGLLNKWHFDMDRSHLTGTEGEFFLNARRWGARVTLVFSGEVDSVTSTFRSSCPVMRVNGTRLIVDNTGGTATANLRVCTEPKFPTPPALGCEQSFFLFATIAAPVILDLQTGDCGAIRVTVTPSPSTCPTPGSALPCLDVQVNTSIVPVTSFAGAAQENVRVYHDKTELTTFETARVNSLALTFLRQALRNLTVGFLPDLFGAPSQWANAEEANQTVLEPLADAFADVTGSTLGTLPLFWDDSPQRDQVLDGWEQWHDDELTDENGTIEVLFNRTQALYLTQELQAALNDSQAAVLLAQEIFNNQSSVFFKSFIIFRNVTNQLDFSFWTCVNLIRDFYFGPGSTAMAQDRLTEVQGIIADRIERIQNGNLEYQALGLGIGAWTAIFSAIFFVAFITPMLVAMVVPIHESVSWILCFWTLPFAFTLTLPCAAAVAAETQRPMMLWPVRFHYFLESIHESYQVTKGTPSKPAAARARRRRGRRARQRRTDNAREALPLLDRTAPPSCRASVQ